MGIDWEIVWFAAACLGLFVVLPTSIYMVARRILSQQVARTVIGLVNLGGVFLGVFMIAYPFANSPTQPGGLGLLLLIPLGAMLGVTCLILLWLNMRKR